MRFWHYMPHAYLLTLAFSFVALALGNEISSPIVTAVSGVLLLIAVGFGWGCFYTYYTESKAAEQSWLGYVVGQVIFGPFTAIVWIARRA